jgi:multidrug resistance efflux pump
MIMKPLFFRAGVLRISVALLLILGLLVGGIAFFWGGGRKVAAGTEDKESAEPEQSVISVKSVYPRCDKTFSLKEKRPADVEAYYQADLETKVPGIISMIDTEVGDVVKKGEILVQVDVPDLEARRDQREADWERAKTQVTQMEAAVDVAKSDIKVAKARIKSTTAKWKSDTAYYEFRKKQAARFHDLFALRSIEARLVDEQEDRLETSLEAMNASEEAKNTAEAQKEAADARLKQAKADLKEAESKVKVTLAEWQYAKVMVEYAKVKAPFDGTIVRRNVDPGFFVQNAGNGRATPLLRIQRNDIVTVVVRVPDNFATFVTPQTEAIFETASLPGVKIHGKVTRFPPSLDNPESDRTMVVEVDLWNGSAEEFNAKKNDPEFRKGLKKGMPGDPNHGLPIVPQIQGRLAGGRQMRLLPGMFGQMTLLLRNFNEAYMLPSSAIVTQGGYTYIYLVQDGKAHLQPVKVQVDDGKLVKVELLSKNGEILGDLTGKENVIVSNQAELNEGQPVKATLVEDWGSLNAKKESH